MAHIYIPLSVESKTKEKKETKEGKNKFRKRDQGIPRWLGGLAPAFGLESQDRVLYWAPGMEPASPSSSVSASLSLYVYHK